LTLSERRMLNDRPPVLADSPYTSHLSAGHMLDEQLDQEMQSKSLVKGTLFKINFPQAPCSIFQFQTRIK
jgi:hypothetical protein